MPDRRSSSENLAPDGKTLLMPTQIITKTRTQIFYPMHGVQVIPECDEHSLSLMIKSPTVSRRQQPSFNDELQASMSISQNARAEAMPTLGDLQNCFQSKKTISANTRMMLESGSDSDTDVRAVHPCKAKTPPRQEQQKKKRKESIVVVVVDDSVTLLNLYSRMFVNAGVRNVIKLQSGEACLDMLFGDEHQTVDVLLVDDKMPGIRGPDMVAQVSTECTNREIRPPYMYICSGSCPKQLQEEFTELNSSVQAVLQKPLTKVNIAKILSECTSCNEAPSNLVALEDEYEMKRLSCSGSKSLKHSSFPDENELFRLDVSALLINQLQVEHMKKEIVFDDYEPPAAYKLRAASAGTYV